MVLVYLVLPMLLTDQSHVLCAQYESSLKFLDLFVIAKLTEVHFILQFILFMIYFILFDVRD